MVVSVPQGSALKSSSFVNDGILKTVREMRPVKPLYALSPENITRAAEGFVKAFPGTVLYATKTNPDPEVLKALTKGGILAFDFASLPELQHVKSLFPNAQMHFMHTVKMPEDIHAAYFDYGVRHFVLDHEEELFKIMR